MPFLESIRQLRIELPMEDCCHIHVSLLPYLEAVGEVKTKPTQHSVRELTSLGLQPDIIVCRTNANVEITEEMKKKIALFCNLKNSRCIIHNKDCKSLYSVQIMLQEQKIDEIVLDVLHLKSPKANMIEWKEMVAKMENLTSEVLVAIVGKYTAVPDAYISVIESLKHAGLKNNVKVNVKLIDCEEVEKLGPESLLQGISAVVVPGGFGNRGIEGKIATAKFCRENNIPFLGICLGMQIAVTEFARNICGLIGATAQKLILKQNII